MRFANLPTSPNTYYPHLSHFFGCEFLIIRSIFSPTSILNFLMATLLMCSSIVLSTSANAKSLVTISKIDRTNRDDLSGISRNWRVKIFGEISKGTLEQLESNISDLIAKGTELSDIVLFLDSPGRNFAEAIEIADYISSNGIVTAVDRKAVCRSACAFVFMAGREPPYEGPGAVSRYLHIYGELGFHAPFLGYDAHLLDKKFNGTNRDVSRAYQTGLFQVGQLLTGYGSTGTKWPPSLVGRVLQIPQDKFLKIITVDDAGRWNISIVGYNKPQIEIKSKKSKFQTCLNAFRWTDEEKWIEYHLDVISTDEYLEGWSSQVTKISAAEGVAEAYYVPIDNLNVLGCNIYRWSEAEEWIVDTNAGFNGETVTHLMSLDPRLKLKELFED